MKVGREATDYLMQRGHRRILFLGYDQKFVVTTDRYQGYEQALTAAGIANGEDVYNTIIAGADATGSSSGVAKAADRAAMVDEMIAAVRKAWDERHN